MAHLVLPNGKGHGWRRDTPNPVHDRRLSARLAVRKPVPDRYYLKADAISPTRDQGQQGSCHDDQTEVLTEQGWQLFSRLTGRERLATVEPTTRKMTFEQPVRLFRFDYVGPMVCVRNRSFDFKVTPNHMMLVRKWDEAARTLKSEFEFVRAADLGWYAGCLGSFETEAPRTEHFELPARPDAKLKAQRQPRTVSMSAWLRFLGLYLAEGTICRRAAREGRVRDEWKVQIAGVKKRERAFIVETLSALGIDGLALRDRFTFHDMQMIEALWQLGLGGVKAGHKFVPQFVFHQSSEHIREFLLGHFMGDGCATATTSCHYTSSTRLADDLHALVVMSGSQSRLTSRDARASVMANGRAVNGNLREHRVSVRKKPDPSIERKKNVFTEHYAGEVFCAEVPSSHTLVTRRNGHVLVAGNCTGHGAVGALEWSARAKLRKDLNLSPAMAYLNGRIIEASVKEDSGCEIRDVIKGAARDGICLNKYAPYSDRKLLQNVSKQAARNALAHQVRIGYYRADDVGASRDVIVDNMLQAILADLPIVGGYCWFSCLDTADFERTGVMAVPTTRDRLEGGHCNWGCGFDVPSRMFLLQNSYGPDFGAKHPISKQGGFVLMPFAYVLNGVSDDWWACEHE